MRIKDRLRKILHHSRVKYRLIISDIETFEEYFSFKLTGMSLFILLGAGTLVLVLCTVLLIAFTPLREYIPGYTDSRIIHISQDNAGKADSLLRIIDAQSVMLTNMQLILSGEELPALDAIMPDASKAASYENISQTRSKDDSLFRVQMEAHTRSNPSSPSLSHTAPLQSFLFFSPVRGIVISGFDKEKHHFGIDIATTAHSAVMAVLNGVVIQSEWTLYGGNTITILHPQHVVSVYKHCSTLLKKQGDYVQTGEPIAFTGNSGSQSSGSHLHFELWYKGFPVNSKEYLSFE